MPPRAKITREMVIDAAFAVARAAGVENVNARTVSSALNCSTQPVMYHFSTIGALKRAVYEKTGEYHTEYLLHIPQNRESVMLEIGLNYIRFAVKEPNLFRVLFQSGLARENSLAEMMDSEELAPVLSAMGKAMDLGAEQTRDVFVTLAMFAHGYASMLANDSMAYDEAAAAAHLKRTYKGALLAIREENGV